MAKAKQVDPREWLKKTLEANTKLTPEQRTAALAAFDDDDTLSAFNQEYVPVPTFKSEMQKRDDKIKEVEGWNVGWINEHIATLRRLGAVDALKAFAKQYDLELDLSDLESTPGGGARDRSTGDTYSRTEVESMMKNALAEQEKKILSHVDQVRTSGLGFTEFVTDRSGDYKDSFGKKFPVADFRKFTAENASKYSSLDAAYDAFTADDRKKKDTDDRAKWEADTRKAIERDIRSKASTPDFTSPGGTGKLGAFHSGSHKPPVATEPRYSYSIGANLPTEAVETKTKIAAKYPDVDVSSIPVH
jgi:hypothetical protein